MMFGRFTDVAAGESAGFPSAASVRYSSAIRFQAASSSATRAGSFPARLFVSQRSVARS
jgi:hypothetical protein